MSLKGTILVPYFDWVFYFMKCRGKGDYQDTLESITELKIIQKLAIKPYNYELLRNETKIHRNRVREILDSFTKMGVVIPHKYNFINTTINGYECIKIKPGLEYYILDLDNKQSLKYLRDIKLDTKIKDYIKFFKVTYAHKGIKMRYSTKNKRIMSFCFRDRNEIEYNKIKQFIKISLNSDPSFSIVPYLLPEQVFEFNRQEYSFLTKLRETNFERYSEYMQILNVDNMKSDNNHFELYKKQKEIKEDTIKNLLEYCSIRGLSRYDLLIFLSWSFPSQENYIKFWNIIRNTHTNLTEDHH